MIGFEPVHAEGEFKTFWSLDQGWGQICFDRNMIRLSVMGGSMTLRLLRLRKNGIPMRILADGVPVQFSFDGQEIHFSEKVTIMDRLEVFYEE